MTDYKLTDVIDKIKLREMLAKFTEATDLAAIPCDLTGKNITDPTNFTRHCHMVRSTEMGKKLCYASDEEHGRASMEQGKPIIFPCHCGLMDLAAPIVVEGKCYGYILCGQVFLEPPEAENIRQARVRAEKFGLDVNDYVQSFLEVKVFTKQRLISATEMLNIFSNYIVELGINNLMQQRLLEEERLRLQLENTLHAMELKVLQSQLNPHFLFNTLNTAARLSYLENAKRTEEIIYSLASLLRYSLRNLEQFVSLKEEITYIQHYLHIQKARYQDQLKTTIDVPEKLQDILIPVMTLQPLVENAIIHGLEQKEDNWELIIKAYEEQEMLIIEIIDNGVGMDSKTLNELNNFTRKGKGHITGIGIPNVDIRIKRYFGSEYGIEVDSKLGNGTVTRLTLPKSYMESTFYPINQ
ncbi:Histidine kinase [Tepidanaerobacter acetatoxydans Re1]|uniref:Histidine kinase n=1 Tax=Tepidanaerobacter acetatoxydans (strain DSM 21804 / JCM 16047 / Re1) TaxID=1209989 RepID=F4LQT9_TEPAE|nr:PocR ligand-binding domain-containing protein [Tepidanaerobacter acetatoxydans]AEE92092.1 histidine kinase [Tepidanaerobacter acetatoxydans Re1]CCP26938.1 Histidine kinase [Tepidanaerobacter acetatoxydans Re1]